MIGIYAFKDGARLQRELQHLIDNDIKTGKEYQLPDALRSMTRDGLQFVPGECRNGWTVATNRYCGNQCQDPQHLA